MSSRSRCEIELMSVDSVRDHRRRDDHQPNTNVGGSEPKSSWSSRAWVRCVSLLLILICYLFVGAFLFRWLERPSSMEAAEDFQSTLGRLAHDNDCMDDGDVVELMSIITRAIGEAAYTYDSSKIVDTISSENYTNASYIRDRWTVENSFGFCYTVVTTVGYGALAPRSEAGQLVCVMYALIGFFLAGGLLLNVGDLFTFLWWRQARVIDRLRLCAVSYPRLWRAIQVVNGTLVVYSIVVLVPSIFFWRLEGWTYIASNYFAVISFTTIGLGDFVPNIHNVKSVWKRYAATIFSCLFFFIALGIVSTLAGIVSVKQRQAAKTLKASVQRAVVRRMRAYSNRTDDSIKTNSIQDSIDVLSTDSHGDNVTTPANSVI